MSDPEDSTNNQGAVLNTPIARHVYTRAKKYYYHDGSKIFLVGSVLFKVKLNR